MIELKGINKYFPSNDVSALENANYSLRSAEIHALLGENGTGKSTLMHILAGYFTPTSGSIFVDGKQQRFSAPADALALGIGMVRQHPGFVRGFKVWEDCILGAEKQSRKSRFIFFNPALSRRRVLEVSDKWGFDLPLDRRTEDLTLSQRQKAAVLALLLRDIKYFIFDELTAVLTPEETNNLFELFRRLRNEGCGIILITHKLHEALSITDRITVIRNGTTHGTRNTNELTIEELKKAIFSNDTVLTANPGINHVKTALYEDNEVIPALIVKNLTIEAPGLAFVRNVSFNLKPGMILGINGVRDSGLEALEPAIAGFLDQQSARFDGSITLNGSDITGRGVRAFREAGGAYLGADRLGANLAPEFPIKESLMIHAFRRARRCFGIFLDMAFLNSWCRKIMDMAGIERSASDRAASFSGGMLQRILLAREFAEGAVLLVLSEAGSGLDQASRFRLSQELKALANEGTAVLLFSADIEELVSFADEIMILSDGTLSASLLPKENNEK